MRKNKKMEHFRSSTRNMPGWFFGKCGSNAALAYPVTIIDYVPLLRTENSTPKQTHPNFRGI
jgi:hypothetical protein